MSKYQNAKNTRRENRTLGGRFKSGKLAPVMAMPFMQSEGGIVTQSVTFELDPVAGRMITPIVAEVISVFVPVQAIDAIKDPSADYAGSEVVVRDKLLSGAPLFTLEEEGEISKRLGVVPESIAGVKSVNEMSRLAHNCAVNYLRRRKYVKATQLLHGNIAMTPALIGQTTLERLNGVLDPEDRINGSMALDFNSMQIPIKGIGKTNTTFGLTGSSAYETGAAATRAFGKSQFVDGTDVIIEEDPDNTGYPAIFANMEGITTGTVSIQDFYEKEKMDALTRQMRQIVDKNPEYGEEMVLRWAHGFSVDSGKQPYIVHQSTETFGAVQRYATDGASLDDSQTDLMAQIAFTAPIAPSEFGGVLITFAVLKPDETLASQPHPILSQPWGAINMVADEMALDPESVTIRQLDGDCDVGDEGTIALWIGHNNLMRNYVNYGFNRHMDLADVANKTALWQLEVPMSVTPENVIYPADLEQYPFGDNLAEVCTYTVSNVAVVRTPIQYGPTPLEELAIIETGDVFEDA